MNIEIKINIPGKQEILAKVVTVNIAGLKQKWSKIQLGAYADLSGVYIHTFDEKILYVGQTTKENSKWTTFAERLRREFQESSSQNSRLHQLLVLQDGKINTSMYSLAEIDKMFICSNIAISSRRKALIIEQIFIDYLEASGNNI